MAINPNLARTLAWREKQLSSEKYGNVLQAIETNDCSVRAFQTLTGCTYSVAHATCESLGRNRHNGLPAERIDQYVKAFEAFGVRLDRLFGSVKLDNGRFLLWEHGHLAAVVDGRAVNGWSGRWDNVIAVWAVK